MNVVIQKYGGTSLATEKARRFAADKIIKSYDEGNKLVVVVSAMGRKESPYSTDSLIQLVNRDFINKRDLDLLMFCGEVISAVALGNLLLERGYKNTIFTGWQAGIVTDNNYGNASIIKIDPMNIKKELKKDKIVIVTGFQGITKFGDVTTLGRGGSDITAVALGEALKCKYVEIYTDVDGIMTADPRIVHDAKLIKSVCYSEVYQLAEDGAKVIHPRAIEIAQRSNIILKIKNTLNNCKGTVIKNNEIQDNGSPERDFKNVVTSITYKKNRVQIIIYTNKDDICLFMEEISNNKVNIDLINFFTDRKVFTIDMKDLDILKHILNKHHYKYEIISNCCKISVIGHKMHGTPGVMSRIVKTLKKEKINILQSSDSHNTIWILVNEMDAEKAIISLHDEFNLAKE